MDLWTGLQCRIYSRVCGAHSRAHAHQGSDIFVNGNWNWNWKRDNFVNGKRKGKWKCLVKWKRNTNENQSALSLTVIETFEILHDMKVAACAYLRCPPPRSTWPDPCGASLHTTERDISTNHLQIIRIKKILFIWFFCNWKIQHRKLHETKRSFSHDHNCTLCSFQLIS